MFNEKCFNRDISSFSNLGGFIVYDKILKEIEKLECTTENDSNFEKNINDDSNSLQQVSSIKDSVMFRTSYGFGVYNKEKEAIFLHFNDIILDEENILGKSENYDTGVRVSEDGSTKLDSFKLDVDKDVRGIYSFPSGQADLESLVIIFEDGTVNVLNVNASVYQSQNGKSNYDISIESYIKNYENITNAIAAYDSSSIDASGFDFIYFN